MIISERSDRLLLSQSSQQLLKLYQQLLDKKSLDFVDNSPLLEEFLLTGLVDLKNGKIKLYNRIYESIFHKNWLKNNLKKIPAVNIPLMADLGTRFAEILK